MIDCMLVVSKSFCPSPLKKVSAFNKLLIYSPFLLDYTAHLLLFEARFFYSLQSLRKYLKFLSHTAIPAYILVPQIHRQC